MGLLTLRAGRCLTVMNASLLLIVAALFAASQAAADTLTGDWRGDSICVVRSGACADEKALYHIKKLDQSNHYSMQADKIVNGEPVNMGTTDCIFAPEKKMLTCALPKGVIRLVLRGIGLEGTMNLADGTLWRNISLAKNPPR